MTEPKLTADGDIILVRVSEHPLVCIPTILQCLENSDKFSRVRSDSEMSFGFEGCSERAIYWEVCGGVVIGDVESDNGPSVCWTYSFYHGDQWWIIGSVDITQLPEYEL